MIQFEAALFAQRIAEGQTLRGCKCQRTIRIINHAIEWSQGQVFCKFRQTFNNSNQTSSISKPRQTFGSQMPCKIDSWSLVGNWKAWVRLIQEKINELTDYSTRSWLGPQLTFLREETGLEQNEIWSISWSWLEKLGKFIKMKFTRPWLSYSFLVKININPLSYFSVKKTQIQQFKPRPWAINKLNFQKYEIFVINNFRKVTFP